MKLKFKAIQKKDPRNIEASAKYYASPVYSGTYTTDDLSSHIANMCSISEIDIVAVLRSFEKVFPELLAKGFRIDLKGVGMFSLGLESFPSEKEEDVKPDKIKRCKLRFKGEYKLRKSIINSSVERI